MLPRRELMRLLVIEKFLATPESYLRPQYGSRRQLLQMISEMNQGPMANAVQSKANIECCSVGEKKKTRT
jgi:hypothetical protein